jgi:hypothetical protein
VGDLEGAFRVRGLGGANLTQTVRLHRVDAHDNRGNGVHVGLGVRGIVMTEQTTDRNGKDGTVLDGSESRIDGLRSRGNGRAGVQFRNLLATQGTGIQAVGNLHGVRALSLVGADLHVVAHNNRRADVWFDPTLIGGCVGLSPTCQTNYGRTRAVRIAGVVGPTYTLSGYSAVTGSTPYLNPDPAQQVVDRTDLLTTG